MKRTGLAICMITILLPCVGADFGHGQEKGRSDGGLEQLYNAAKKEGRAVLWGPTDAIIDQRAQEALNKKYPEIKIEHFESIPEPVVQRIISRAIGPHWSDAWGSAGRGRIASTSVRRIESPPTSSSRRTSSPPISNPMALGRTRCC